MPLQKTMLAYCGLYCGLCSFKLAHDEGDIKHLKPIPYSFNARELSEYNCEGCKGYCICGPCKIKACAEPRGIDSCADCGDFPCALTTAFENDGMPHHRGAGQNLRAIREIGVEAWYARIEPSLKCACGEAQSWYYHCPKHG